MDYIKQLNWRYAVKKFDADKKVAEEKIERLEQSIQLATSSYGLQPYKVFKIENSVVRKQLFEHSLGQEQVVDASHLYVFCNMVNYTPAIIDDYIKLKSEVQDVELAKIEGFGTFMKKHIGSLTTDAFATWTAKQCYIALDSLLVACAMEEVDACPMEGFKPEGYNQLLNLDEQGLNACLIVPVGYRSSEDSTQHATKVRKPLAQLLQTV